MYEVRRTAISKARHWLRAAAHCLAAALGALSRTQRVLTASMAAIAAIVRTKRMTWEWVIVVSCHDHDDIWWQWHLVYDRVVNEIYRFLLRHCMLKKWSREMKRECSTCKGCAFASVAACQTGKATHSRDKLYHAAVLGRCHPFQTMTREHLDIPHQRLHSYLYPKMLQKTSGHIISVYRIYFWRLCATVFDANQRKP